MNAAYADNIYSNVPETISNNILKTLDAKKNEECLEWSNCSIFLNLKESRLIGVP